MPCTEFDYQSGENPPCIPADEYDPRNTFLTDRQEEIVGKFLYTNSVVLSRPEIQLMIDTGLLTIHLPLNIDWFRDMPRTATCSLNLAGQKYLKYRIELAAKERKENFRYRLTTGIAVIGAIVAVISLVWAIQLQQAVNMLP